MVLGIANTSSLTVSQRVREIGTLRALGLSSDQVRKLVQWEALFIGMMGWGIGFLSGTIVASSILNVIYEAEELGVILAPGRTVPFLVVGSAIAVVIAALVGAEVPARRASRMSPTEALGAPL
jgi:putative ABC transport system permease protein